MPTGKLLPVYDLHRLAVWLPASRATTGIAKQRYVWIVWKHGHQGPTYFRWLSTRALRMQTRLQ